MKGILYIVATPIGNLEDITFRAVRILKEVDWIACEDTRHTQKLLNHFEIRKPLTSYFDHNKQTKGSVILAALERGENVALVSDAGTPAISDPGYNLVRAALESGLQVVSIPGPSAAIAGLASSGLPTDRFLFLGFPPMKEGRKRRFFESAREERGTLILYESPHRIVKCLRLMKDVLGDRLVVLAHELTKIHEGTIRGRISEILRNESQIVDKGEYVILVEGNIGEKGGDYDSRDHSINGD